MWGKPNLNDILGELESTITELEAFALDKNAEVDEHYVQIESHQRHVELKTADADRAGRIMTKLQELLA